VSGTLSGDLANREITRVKPSTNAFVWGIQLAGGSVYVTDLLNGLYQLRLSGTALVVAGGGGNVPDRYSTDVWVSGNHAYTGTWGGQPRNGVPGNAVKIWQLDALGAPSLADSVLLDSVVTANDVKGSGDGRVMVVSGDKGARAGLYVYDLADALHPALVAEALVPAGIHTARVTDIGGRRYVFAARNPGSSATPALLIYDLADLIR
jgi:hypothetical protein